MRVRRTSPYGASMLPVAGLRFPCALIATCTSARVSELWQGPAGRGAAGSVLRRAGPNER